MNDERSSGIVVGDDFDVRLEIETPERVQITHDLAGIGSRFAAGTVDLLLIAFAFTLLLTIVLVVAPTLLTFVEPGALMLAIAGGFTALLALYYIGFELVMSGQTPGKRMLRLRVVATNGGPASAVAIVLRNLLRVADALPIVVAHVLGGVVMFVTSRSQRIGDLAAGTIVVRERELEFDVTRLVAPERDAAWRADDLDDDERAVVERFVAREAELLPDVATALARRIVESLAARRELPDIADATLLRLLAEGHAPGELRDRSGPRGPRADPRGTAS